MPPVVVMVTVLEASIAVIQVATISERIPVAYRDINPSLKY